MRQYNIYNETNYYTLMSPGTGNYKYLYTIFSSLQILWSNARPKRDTVSTNTVLY